MRSPLEDIIAVGILIFGMACMTMIIFAVKSLVRVILGFVHNLKGSIHRHFHNTKEDPDYLEHFTVDGRSRKEVFPAILEDASLKELTK